MVDNCKFTVSLGLKGDVAWYTERFAKSKGMTTGSAAKEIYLAGLKSMDLIHPDYTMKMWREGV